MGERGEKVSEWIAEHKATLVGIVVALFVVVGLTLAMSGGGQKATIGKEGKNPQVVTSKLPPNEDGPLRAAERAYAAWSSYTSSGDPKLLGDAFVKDGPQFRRLIADFELAAASATPTDFVMLEPKVLPSEVPTTRTVRAEVKVEQAGFPDRFYQFDMIMQRSEDSKWRAFDVAAGIAPVPSSDATTATTVATTSAP